MKRTNYKKNIHKELKLPKRSDLLVGTFFKQHWKLLLFILLFLIGILIGSLVVKSTSENILNMVKNMFNNYVQQRSNQSFWATFLNSILSTVPFLLLSFFMGIFALGTPVTFCIPFFRGLGIGVTAGYLYANYALQGIAFTALLIIPHGFISSFVIILASGESFTLSAKMFSVITPNGEKNGGLWKDVHMYLLRYLFFTALLLLSSLLDTLMSVAFMRFFSF